ncbi:GntR family transcriptional regulator [Aerococcus urinaehominis]|uniref:GntR family transcriptional regulator n=1 Tax=Aerococcus urinaehominis TaxID=128944 RepID=A0A109RGH4_9LACT|nr:GntR family transcriptional regulator [Aerococcus urinaehominis]AMB98556.1 GntR family transcriptional regulator [Aerococcus urinaehominis]SDL78133.1 GntR family transcriptional regulator, transcriptional regulator of bglA [Aerococcus urinaehominis]
MLKYEKIAQKIYRYITDHQLQQGDKLPSLDELTNNFLVSKNTVIKALEMMEKQGLIYQVRGSGIFVRQPRRKGYINLMDLQGFNSSLREFDLNSQVLALDLIPANEELCRNLDLAPGDPVYYVNRVRYIEGRPFCIEASYFPQKLVPYLSEEIATSSLFSYLRQGLGLDIHYVDHFMRARRLHPEEAKHLQLKSGDPTIVIESNYYLADGMPVDFSKICYHYNETQFFSQGEMTSPIFLD